MRTWSQIPDHGMSFLKSCCAYSAHLVVGLMAAIIGPTLLDLRLQVNSDLTTVASVVTFRAVGHAVGSLMSESFDLSRTQSSNEI